MDPERSGARPVKSGKSPRGSNLRRQDGGATKGGIAGGWATVHLRAEVGLRSGVRVSEPVLSPQLFMLATGTGWADTATMTAPRRELRAV